MVAPGASAGSGQLGTSATVRKSVGGLWCRAPLDRAWRLYLRSRPIVPLARHHSVLPFAISDEGGSFFASIYTKQFSGIARIDAESGRYERIKRFQSPANDQASGDFDGRWLVWTEYHSLVNVGEFTIWSWDSRTDRLRRLAESGSDPNGDPWPSAWESAHVRDGFATWEQGVGPGERGEIHVVDLRTGRDRVVERGLVGSPVIVSGPIVLWPRAPERGLDTSPRAANARTGKPVRVPTAFRHSHGLPKTDGRAVAETSGTWRSLWYSPSLSKQTVRVFVTPDDSLHVDNSVQVSDRYVSFGTDIPSQNFGDAVLGRYIELSPGLGWSVLNEKALILVRPAARPRKVGHPILRITFLPLSSVPPIPACAKLGA